MTANRRSRRKRSDEVDAATAPERFSVRDLQRGWTAMAAQYLNEGYFGRCSKLGGLAGAVAPYSTGEILRQRGGEDIVSSTTQEAGREECPVR